MTVLAVMEKPVAVKSNSAQNEFEKSKQLKGKNHV
jgi:hypothetical protein